MGRTGDSFGGQGRDLAPWETIALGALAGALASVGTTPADVMKTRIMTSAADKAVNPAAILQGIVQNEGVGAALHLHPQLFHTGFCTLLLVSTR